MQITFWKQGFVLLIILLFVGSGIIPSTVGINEKNNSQSILRSGGYIQGLIDNASAGDTIYVPSGIYYENIIINKSISLIGEDKNTTIIDGGGNGDVIYVSAEWVNISGCTIRNVGGWLGIVCGSKNTINENIFLSNRISLVWLGDTIISDNIFIESSIEIFECGGLIIDNNTFTNGTHGLSLSSGWGSVCDNVFSNNSFFNTGVYIEAQIHNNTFSDNTVNGKPFVFYENESDMIIDEQAGQIILNECDNITIKNQHVSNTTIGLHLINSNNCHINNNTISSNHMYGLLLSASNNTIVSDNMISKNEEGILIYGLNNYIKRNIFSDNALGIKVFGPCELMANTITDNTILNNVDGIIVSDAPIIITNNLIEGNSKSGLTLSGWLSIRSVNNNTIKNNEDGIFLSYSSNNNIASNTISNNINGIRLRYWCHDNNILNNNITDNCFGIQFKGSGEWNIDIKNNTISNNNIISNHEEGIIFSNTSNNRITGNFISKNEDGIELIDSSNNSISGNTIKSNQDHGLEIHSSSEEKYNNNIIDHNLISSNNKGIFLKKASNNSINNNNFLKNKRHALFSKCTNIWESNYWNRPRLLPKIIFGNIGILSLIPWVNIDWRPAQEPYSIG